jgi:hypothetical protein
MLGTHNTPQLPIWPKGFECLLPSMVQASLSSSTNSLRIWPTMKFSPTSLPPLLANAPCPFMDKGHQTIATSLLLHSKFCIQAILETLQNFKVECIMRNCLVMPKPYAP